MTNQIQPAIQEIIDTNCEKEKYLTLKFFVFLKAFAFVTNQGP